MMWQEARKQERKIRGMLVDYKRRAERRKDYYEKIKADPTQFIQIHGRPCKIHLDPAVAIAGDSPANMMSWQGNHDILIDRFDVRAHLDYIPDNKSAKDEEEEVTSDERYINYERYRILAQNDFLGVSEDKFLHQLSVEEQFGPMEKTEPQPIEGKKKVTGAAIGYNYSEGTPVATGSGEPVKEDKQSSEEEDNEDDDEEDDEDSDIDFDLCVDVNKISSAQAHEMNASALSYGMMSNDFFSFLTKDVEEAENLKLAREREEEKAMFSGRKSRRERRAFREKKLIGRKLSPPSYAASKAAPIADLIRQVSKSRSRSRSRSVSPPNAGMIQYITSFGGDETPLEPPPPQIIKTSVHSSKEDDNIYKRTVRYRSSRSPESSTRRDKSISIDKSHNYHSWSRDKKRSPENSRKSRSHSPAWRSKSPGTRTVRYRSRSRSPNRSVRSKSPVVSRFNDRARNQSDRVIRKRQSLSKSKSPSPTATRVVKKSISPQPVRSIEVPAPPVITRYYGRRKNNSSSSELDLSDSEDKSDQTSDKVSVPDKNTQAVGNSGGRTKPAAPASATKLSLQERLKKKRQALINRQYKADKRAERLRQEKAEQERQDREDEMREISIKMRRRERQKRHQYYELDESNAVENSEDDRLSTASTGSGSDKAGSESEHRSRSRSSRKGKEKEVDKSRGSSRDRDKSRGRDRDSRRDSDSRRDRERSGDRDRRSRRSRDEERYRGRDRSKEKTRDRSREKDRYRREKDRSRDRDKEKSRDRDRYSGRRSKEREQNDSSAVTIKKPIRPLVDY